MARTSPPKTASSRAYQILKDQILSAELAPNEHLLEADLAAQLGMSRTPLREACVRLQAEGLVKLIPRRGVQIVPISPSDMAEIYDLLATLEARAAELAASRGLADEALRPMDDAVQAMIVALEASDLDGWADADHDFHRALVECSGNSHLAAAALRFSDQVQRARLATLRMRPTPLGSATDHAELVQAIRTGHADQAHEMHLTHRRIAANELVKLLERYRITSM